MTRTILAAVGIAFAAAASVAAAQPAPSGASTQGVRIPQIIARDDVAAQVKALFMRLDGNRDGALTQAETQAVERKSAPGGISANARAMAGRMFALADLDKDGRLTLAEATGSALKQFDVADLNRDGRLTPDERPNRANRRS